MVTLQQIVDQSVMMEDHAEGTGPRFQVEGGDWSYSGFFVTDTELAGGRYVAEFPIPPDMDGDHPFVYQQLSRAQFLARALNAAPRFRVGDRVRFLCSVETAFPCIPVPAGAVGTIVRIDRSADDYIAVRLDDPVLQVAYAEWDGEIWVYGEMNGHSSLDAAAAEHFELATDAPPAPAYTLDGEPVDLLEFLDANPVEDGTWDDDIIDRVLAMEPGQFDTFGGGAAATSILKRTR